jgi:hypothetical protein
MRDDLLSALPSPPLDDIGDHLILPEVVFRHAEKLLADGVLTGVCLGDLRDALARTWLLYVQGQAISEVWKTQRRDILLRARGPRLPRLRIYRELVEQRRSARKRAKRASKHLARPPTNRPKKFSDHFLIQAMRVIWDMHSAATHRGGWTASGDSDSKPGSDGRWRASQEGPFERFVNDWLLTIDRRRPIPSRQLYTAVKLDLERMQKPST